MRNALNECSNASVESKGNNGCGSVTDKNGNEYYGNGGTDGNGGYSGTYSSGGAGLTGIVENVNKMYASITSVPTSFINGGIGGIGTTDGGFGGGGTSRIGGGGGGGYSGGGGCGLIMGQGWLSGGGGGSYGITKFKDNGAVNTKHGKVIITLLD